MSIFNKYKKLEALSFEDVQTFPTRIERSSDVFNTEPLVNGDGGNSYKCGHCNFVLLNKVNQKELGKAAYKCPHCNQYSSI